MLYYRPIETLLESFEGNASVVLVTTTLFFVDLSEELIFYLWYKTFEILF